MLDDRFITLDGLKFSGVCALPVGEGYNTAVVYKNQNPRGNAPNDPKTTNSAGTHTVQLSLKKQNSSGDRTVKPLSSKKKKCFLR